MAQPVGSYDENLLRDAPVATRQQLQEGYTTDLLASPSKPRSLNRTQSPLPDGATAAIPPTALHADLEQGQRSQDGFNHYAPLSEKVIPSSKTPFFRTTKGIVLIVALAIIIVGAVVGAAVGTTVNKSQSNVTATSTSSNPATPNVGASTAVVSNTIAGTNPLGSLTFPTATTSAGQAVGTGSVGNGPLRAGDDPVNGYAMLQSESNAVAAMKQAGHYKRRDASQASGNVDVP